MKYLFLLLLPLTSLAEVVPSPTPTSLPGTIDADQLMQMLSNALAIASGLPGIFGAVFVGLIALVIAILLIAKYFLEKGAREKEAYLTDLKIRQTQEENLARMQKDATSAFLSNMDISYAQDYQYFIQMIKAEKYDAVYAKVASKFHEGIAQFIYDTSISAEDRAARVIMLVKPTT